MDLQSPGAIFVKLGPVTIRWYGVMVASGFFGATYVATELAKRFKMDPEKIINLALCCFVGGIIGARLYFVALSWPQFAAHPQEIIWSSTEGLSIRGLSIHGGMLGALITGFAYCYFTKLPLLGCADIIATALPLGQAIGRWGNFFNSEAFGLPTHAHWPLRLFIPIADRPIIFIQYQYFHPTFLYESLWDLMLFLILLRLVMMLRNYPGAVLFLYLVGYSIGRLCIEPIRIDSIMAPGTMIPAPTLMSAAMLFAGGIGLIWVGLFNFKKFKQAASTDATTPAPPPEPTAAETAAAPAEPSPAPPESASLDEGASQ
jgi:phosphatidylglycerol:prolipoprotein diacylglycerol transferase